VSVKKSDAGKEATAVEWLVYRLGGAKAAFLGHVEAPDHEAALAAAYEEFGVTAPGDRKRIMVRPTS